MINLRKVPTRNDVGRPLHRTLLAWQDSVKAGRNYEATRSLICLAP